MTSRIGLFCSFAITLQVFKKYSVLGMLPLLHLLTRLWLVPISRANHASVLPSLVTHCLVHSPKFIIHPVTIAWITFTTFTRFTSVLLAWHASSFSICILHEPFLNSALMIQTPTALGCAVEQLQTLHTIQSRMLTLANFLH